MAPPYADDDLDVELTRKGLGVAENEKRDSVTDEYERQALESGDTEEALDDISYPEGESASSGDPEISAIKEDRSQ